MHFHTYEERYFSWTFVFFSLKSCVPLHTDYPMTRFDSIPQRAYFILILTCVTQSANLGESASLPQYDEDTESAEVATSDVLLTFLQILLNLKRTFFTLKKNF